MIVGYVFIALFGLLFGWMLWTLLVPTKAERELNKLSKELDLAATKTFSNKVPVARIDIVHSETQRLTMEVDALRTATEKRFEAVDQYIAGAQVKNEAALREEINELRHRLEFVEEQLGI